MTDETTIMTPPPFVEKFKYNELKQINDSVTRKRVYLTPDGEKLPSVTTILSSTKDMTHLNVMLGLTCLTTNSLDKGRTRIE